MSISKQGIVGVTMLAGGGLILFLMGQEPKPINIIAQGESAQAKKATDANTEQAVTIDAATKAKILEHKQKQQDALNPKKDDDEQFYKLEKVEEEAKAKAEAEEKSKAEADTKKSKDKAEATKIDAEKIKSKAADTKKETISQAEIDKTKKSGNYVVQDGEWLIMLANRYGVSPAILAEVNDMHTSENLIKGQKITIPSQKTIANLQASIKQKQAKRKAKIDKETSKKEAGKKVVSSGTPKPSETKKDTSNVKFGIQVALAGDDEGAQKVVKKLRSAGYSVKTSKSDKGINIIIGPTRGRDAAVVLKDKINNDSRVNISGAWIRNW